jgi:hypothetical protein
MRGAPLGAIPLHEFGNGVVVAPLPALGREAVNDASFRLCSRAGTAKTRSGGHNEKDPEGANRLGDELGRMVFGG